MIRTGENPDPTTAGPRTATPDLKAKEKSWQRVKHTHTHTPH